jgi:hypothetical protein
MVPSTGLSASAAVLSTDVRWVARTALERKCSPVVD